MSMVMRAQSSSRVGGQSDEDDVQHRADAGPLLEWNPEHQHQGADGDRDLTERERHMVGQPLMEDVPRIEAQARLHEHRQGEAVEQQTNGETGQAGEHEATLSSIGS
jgi:hypothetical protein